MSVDHYFFLYEESFHLKGFMSTMHLNSDYLPNSIKHMPILGLSGIYSLREL